MDIAERTSGSVVILDLHGKITLGDGGDVALKTKIASVLQHGHKWIVLNLSDVTYVDSAGLGEIVQAFASAGKNGGKLKLLGVPKRVRDLLAITKLLPIFEIFEDEDAAVRSFEK